MPSGYSRGGKSFVLYISEERCLSIASKMQWQLYLHRKVCNVVPHHNKWIYWENIQIFFLYFHWITSMNWKTLRTESVSIGNTNRYRFDHYCTLFIKRSLTASNFFSVAVIFLLIYSFLHWGGISLQGTIWL